MDRSNYSALIREKLAEQVPQPSPRNEIIRSLPAPARYNLVHIITGMRRSGKTFYLFQTMHRLMDEGVPRERLFYFDFSDVRLKPMDDDVMDAVVSEYWRQVPRAREEGCYLFLDEVQEAPDWQGFCQRMAENEVVTLVVTGSSSKVSSEEIATSFRGRSHVHEMFPLSFGEYCTFHDIPFRGDGQDSFSPQETTRYEAAFDDFLIWGGFPGIQDKPGGDRIEILQSYVRDVVARDVAEREGREDISLAMQLALFAIRNTGCELSANDLVKRLAGAGYTAYWEKVNRLLELLRQAYLIHFLPEYTTAVGPAGPGTQKVYAEDPGLAYAVSRASQQDVGKRLETAIYIELRRRLAGHRTDTITSLTVPSARREKVDFLVGDALGMESYELYQVTANMRAEKTRRREITSLEAGMHETGLRTGTIITLDEEDSIEVEKGVIEVVPAWKWTLL